MIRSRSAARILIVAVIPILIFGPLSCGQKGGEKSPVPEEKTGRMEGRVMEPEPPGETSVMVSPRRQQIAGVRIGVVAVKPLVKTLRTVGRVDLDERKVADVQIKFEGFIRDLFVNTTGAYVAKGDPLFTIYSPDVVATQEEYLLALKGMKELSESPFHEIRGESQSLLEAARRRLLLWDIEERHLRDLERTGRPELAMEMHTPISGTVIEKAVLAGGMRVEPGQLLYKIADLSTVWVLADVYESEIAHVRVGQEASMMLAYYPGEVFTGRVGFIYPTLDPQTRTAKVRLEFDNPEGKLKPQMYATVELKIDLGRRLAVPQEAVLDSGDRQIVFIDRGNGHFEPRRVKVGMRADGDYVVLDGLSGGEKVVTSANFLIDSESRLSEAMGGMAGMEMGTPGAAAPAPEKKMPEPAKEKPKPPKKEAPQPEGIPPMDGMDHEGMGH